MLSPAGLAPARLPVRQQLGHHTDAPGLVGEVARTLHGNDWPSFLVAFRGAFRPSTNQLLLGGGDVCFPIVASFILPPGGMWLELDDGSERFGLLAFRLDSLIRVRHVDVWLDQPSACRTLSVAMRPQAERPHIDWEAVRSGDWQPSPAQARKWTAWSRYHLVTELFVNEPPSDRNEYAMARMQGACDLMLLALASSPIVRDELRRAVA